MMSNFSIAFMELFTKDIKLPPELRALPYDINSVLHFGERDYSKNGHRTIIFKDHRVKQNRVGLSPLDLRKIEIVYGPECRNRNRQEQIERCQTYPGVARRKRALEPEKKSLRVNPDITPPPVLTLNTEKEEKNTANVDLILEELGIRNEAEQIVDQVYKLSSLALKNAKLKYCNNSKLDFKTTLKLETKNNNDILGIIEIVANFAKNIVDSAVANLTLFCMESDTIETYHGLCSFRGSDRCLGFYKSTKSGQEKHSTQYRSMIKQSTKHDGLDKQYGHKGYYPARNDSGEAVTDIPKDGNVTTLKTALRRKSEVNFEILRNKRDFEIIRNKRDVQIADNTSTNVTIVEDTVVNRSKDNLRTVSKDADRRKFLVHRYSVKHRHQSGERNWDNSNLSIEVTSIKDMMDSNEDGNKEKVTKMESQIDIKHTEDDREGSRSRHVKKPKNRWVEKDRKEQNYNENRSSKMYRESDTDDKEESLRVTKYIEMPVRNSKEESLEENREFKKYKELSEKENNEGSSEENRQRPSRHSGTESVEEKKEVKKYEETPNRQKSPSQWPTRSPMESSEETTSFRPRTVQLSKSNQEFYDERRWPRGVVPYYIEQDSNYDTDDIRRRLDEVNRILVQRTCVRIQELKEKQLSRVQDYMVLDTSADFVTGRVGGKQVRASNPQM